MGNSATVDPLSSKSPPDGRPLPGRMTPNVPTPGGGPAWPRWVLPLALAAMTTWWVTSGRNPPAPTISYTELYSFVEQGKVATVTLAGVQATGKLKQEESLGARKIKDFQAVLPQQEDRDLLPLLRQKQVDVTVTSDRGSVLEQVVVSFLPWVLILGAWLWISRRMQRVGPGVLPFAGLAARPHRVEPQEGARVRFDDVAGLASAKRDLREVVDFLREPARFRRLGGKLPRGVLLVGPPGTGKTLLARAVAGEADVPFFYVNGSEFIQLYVGVGAQRVRELFDEAKKAGPSIVFIDEIDAVGRARGAGLGGGNDEREQTLNQLLSELDGFTRNDLTVVLAATNRPDVLDTALLRPGRFDRRVVIDRPENKARQSILRLYTKDKPLAPDVALDDLAASTPGFSGADLANLCNEAALTATRRGADAIDASDFASAMDKIVLGDPRETLLDPEERRRVAVHESGHATVARFTPAAEPLRRVSILPSRLRPGSHPADGSARSSPRDAAGARGEACRTDGRLRGRIADPRQRVVRVRERSPRGDRPRIQDGRPLRDERPRGPRLSRAAPRPPVPRPAARDRVARERGHLDHDRGRGAAGARRGARDRHAHGRPSQRGARAPRRRAPRAGDAGEELPRRAPLRRADRRDDPLRHSRTSIRAIAHALRIMRTHCTDGLPGRQSLLGRWRHGIRLLKRKSIGRLVSRQRKPSEVAMDPISDAVIPRPYIVVAGAEDGPDGERVIEEAAMSLNNRVGGELHILHLSPESELRSEATLALLERGRAAIERIAHEAHDPLHVRVFVHIRSGSPWREIIDEAHVRGAHLIVVGTHGRTGASRLLHGSQGEQVLRHAPCPVLVVRSTYPTPPPEPQIRASVPRVRAGPGEPGGGSGVVSGAREAARGGPPSLRVSSGLRRRLVDHPAATVSPLPG